MSIIDSLVLLVVESTDVVVEAWQRDAALVVVDSRKKCGHDVQRVGDRATERPRVQIAVRAAQRDVRAGQPPHPGAQLRHVRGPHGGVGDNYHVAGQLASPLPQQGGEVR